MSGLSNCNARETENGKLPLQPQPQTLGTIIGISQRSLAFSVFFSPTHIQYHTWTLLGLVHTSGWNRNGLFTAGMKRSVLNASELTGGCFTAASFQTQHALFSVRCGGRTAVGGGNGTRNNIPACAHERQNNRTAASIRLPYQASAHIMDLDFKIFERLITEVEKRPALYNKATPEYSHKHCKENIWIEVCEAVVPNWSPMDITARMTTGKSARKPFLFSLQFVCRNSRIFFSNLFVNFDSIT